MKKNNILLHQCVKANKKLRNKNNYQLKQENGEQQIFTKFHEINVRVRGYGQLLRLKIDFPL